MRIQFSRFLAVSALIAAAVPYSAQPLPSPSEAQAAAQEKAKHEDTEVWEPVPKVVTPGATDAAPPSDAIVLFDGKNLDEWVQNQDKSPAKWLVAEWRVDGEQGKRSRATSRPSGLSRTINCTSNGRSRRTSPAPIRRAAIAVCCWLPPVPAMPATSCRSSIPTTTRHTSTVRPAACTSRPFHW